MSALEAFTVVLHDHLPYAWMAEGQPDEEDAICDPEAYLPVFPILGDLDWGQVKARLDDDDDLEEDEEDFDDDFDEDEDYYDDDEEDFDDEDDDLFDDDEDDDLFDDEEDFHAHKRLIPVKAPEWWVGSPAMGEPANGYQRFSEGTRSVLHVRY